MRKYGKIDANQAAIVKALRQAGATATRPDTSGANNPNFKNAGWHTCVACNAAFHSYNKTRKYCSRDCYQSLNNDRLAEMAHSAGKCPKPRKESRQGYRMKCVVCSLEFRGFSRTKYCSNHKVEAKASQASGRVKPSNPKLKESSACQHCGKTFEHYKSNQRTFCSYACHLDSGGAFRAGAASKKARMKYGAKKDANHTEIFNAIKEHCAVYDLSTAGCGVPDGVAYVNGTWQLFDVKNPKTGYGKRGLNPVQRKWVANWRGGPVYLIYTPGEAKEFALGNFCDLKVVTPESAAESLAEKSK